MEDSRATINSVICGTAMCIAVAMASLTVYFILGLLTGIFGMCVTASQHWEDIYWKLSSLIPVIAVIGGIDTGRRTYKNFQLK